MQGRNLQRQNFKGGKILWLKIKKILISSYNAGTDNF